MIIRYSKKKEKCIGSNIINDSKRIGKMSKYNMVMWDELIDEIKWK